jgi:hypothetical protein
MTDAPAVIEATFCGFRTVGGRKQLQLTFEVPIEHSAKVLHALGSPDAVDPSWVAIALLDKQLMKAQDATAPVSTKPDKRNWNELAPATQAGIRCSEIIFQQFLRERRPQAWRINERQGREPDEVAADVVRHECSVSSRADFANNPHAARRWDELNGEFEAWKLVA